jgi:hypothetical protein
MRRRAEPRLTPVHDATDPCLRQSRTVRADDSTLAIPLPHPAKERFATRASAIRRPPSSASLISRRFGLISI